MANAQASNASLGDILLNEGLISIEQLAKANVEKERMHRPLVRLLVDGGVVEERKMLRALSQHLGLDVVDLSTIAPRPEVSEFLNRDQCRRHRMVPIRIDGRHVIVAMEDPTDISAVSLIESASSLSVRPVLATSEGIEAAIGRMPDLSEFDEKEATSSKLVSNVILFALVFAPVLIAYSSYYFIILEDKAMREFFLELKLDGFERVMATVLAWGAWASVAYFIHDMMFGKKKRG